jgi:hypothetical protein
MNETAFFFLTTCLFVTTTVGFVFAWSRARRDREKLQNRLWGIAAAQGLPAAVLTDDVLLPPQVGHSRVEQLEAQIDAMNQQIDRLAESQEFLSRVLTERIDQIPDPRLRTPH